MEEKEANRAIPPDNHMHCVDGGGVAAIVDVVYGVVVVVA